MSTAKIWSGYSEGGVPLRIRSISNGTSIVVEVNVGNVEEPLWVAVDSDVQPAAYESAVEQCILHLLAKERS